MSNKAVFLDRDGVINRIATKSDYYITSVDKFKFLEGVFQAVTLLNQHGYIVIVVTNQRGVPRGFLSIDGLNEIHEYMLNEFSKNDAYITDVKVCVCDQTIPCDCRKPKPGMLKKSSEEYGLDLNASWIIGDSESDIRAGKNAGCRTALVNSAFNQRFLDENLVIRPDIIEYDVLSAVEHILEITDLEKGM
tara:strand:+ start:234 stop:806 length:573 start_codon:yes stop_codon:yes gene_type:complete